MDTLEAQALLREQLQKHRRRTRNELLPLLRAPDVTELVGASGAHYQVEILAVWDDAPNGDLRVIGSIDDGGLRAFVPLTEDFLVSRQTP